MKEYIVGGYLSSKEQRDSLRNEPEQLILDNLKKAYPRSTSVTDLAKELRENTGMVPSTVYKGIENLERHHFVHRLSRHQKKDAALNDSEIDITLQSYIIEQADKAVHLLSMHTDANKRLPEYWLAPGYVEYTEEFSREWSKLLNSRLMEDLLDTITQKLLQLLNIISEMKELKKTRSSTGRSSRNCINCGIDHETRNFLRAMLLQVIDYAEMSPDYIKFLRENNVLNNLGYKIYEDAININKQRQETSINGPRVSEENALAIMARIVAVGERHSESTNFLALNSDGSYIVGVVNNNLVPDGLKEDDLVEYTGRRSVVSDMAFVTVNSIEFVKHDDKKIPRRTSISITPISDIKPGEGCYRVIAKVVKKDKNLIRVYLKDSTGKIEFEPPLSSGIYEKVKVGDTIDFIGQCYRRIDKTVFFDSGFRGIIPIYVME